MPRIKLIHNNLAAFLDMIAWAEGTKDKGDDGYNVMFGGELFTDYSRHPRIINTVGSLKSSAAGRYQLLYRYWASYTKQLRLNGFDPIVQDCIAIQQIREQRAVPSIYKGDIKSAIKLCSNIWASFPGANYGQKERHIDDMIDRFYWFGGMMME